MAKNLDTYRKELDELDNRLVELFCERMDLSKEIGFLKRKNGINICDIKRENEIVDRITSSLPPEKSEYVRELYKTIFILSKKAQDSELSFRLGTVQDIPAVKSLFNDVVFDMRASGLDIWDDVYPNCAVRGDIEKNQLYVLEENHVILAAFSLLDSFNDETANTIKWPCEEKDIMYMFRLGVSPSAKHKGYASKAVEFSKSICKLNGKKMIALYAAEENKPAISFYQKNGFVLMDGSRNEKITEMFTLRELGFCLAV